MQFIACNVTKVELDSTSATDLRTMLQGKSHRVSGPLTF